MKILVISHLFPNTENKNYGIFMARQLIEMARQGMEITVIVPTIWTPPFMRIFKKWRNYDHDVPLCQFPGLNAIPVPYLRITGNWFYRWAGKSMFLALKKSACKLHKENNYQIIYARSFFPDGDAAVRLAKVLKLPAVCVGIGRDINIIPHYSKAIYKRFVEIANRLDGTIASGKAAAKIIDSVSGKQTLSVYGVVDLHRFTPVADKIPVREKLGLPLHKKLVLYLGTFKRDKGVYEMLEAFKQLHDEQPEAILEICGYGVEKEGMLRFIQEQGLESAIIMQGAIDNEQVNLWMQACDLFVLPTWHEGMPNAVMEAMACGAPVVVSAVGGLPDAIGDCPGAILIPPKNVVELKNAMLRALANDDLLKKMSLAARQRAEQSFGVEKTARTIINYLATFVNKTV
ncbi:MAG TPA: glycosyltransferase [bacterium]|nr:glycosyltransferase [bacterium]HPN45609.1 glycosyltransferase [bacterium]